MTNLTSHLSERALQLYPSLSFFLSHTLVQNDFLEKVLLFYLNVFSTYCCKNMKLLAHAAA